MNKIDRQKIKTWLVTGASSGIGNCIAKTLIARGYNVVALSRRKPNIKGDNALNLSVDVRNIREIENAIDLGIKRFKKIDVLVNNVGITCDRIAEYETEEHLLKYFDTNYFTTFKTIKCILPHFRKNKNGTIINNISQSGLAPRLNGTAYCSTKYAIEGLTGVLWMETYRFCRVMSFECGHFSQTEIHKKKEVFKPLHSEYNNLKNIHDKSGVLTYNMLIPAVNVLIDTVEESKLPRRLILGSDAIRKTKQEIKHLKKSVAYSKKFEHKINKYKFARITFVTKKILRKILPKKLINLLKKHFY